MQRQPLLTLATFLLFSITINAQVLQWAKKAGGTSNDNGYKSVVDVNGNLYLSGSFQGNNVDFDPGGGTFLLNSAGVSDGFVAKYDKLGNFKWAFRIGGSSQDEVGDIALDYAGNLVITGFFRGNTVDFDPSSNTANLNSNGESGGDPGYGGDIFVAKYDTSGNYKWAFNVGGSDIGDNGTAIYADKNNDIVVTGYFRSIVDFDPSPAVSNLDQSTGTLFVAKYNANGQYQWAFNAGQGGTVDNTGFDVITDNLNNVIVTGFFQGINIDFDPSSATNYLSSNGGFEFFVAKYSPAGQYIWARSAGGSGADVGRALTIDAANDIYVTGDYSSSTINFNFGVPANLLLNKGANDLFLVKYSSSGQHLWSFATGGNGVELGYSISRDNENNIVIAGAFTGTNVDFDPSPNTISLSSQGGSDIYAVKYSSTGNYLCSFRVGGPQNDIGKSISCYENFSYITGVFNGVNIDFDPTAGTTLLTSSADDAFFSKYDWTIIPPAGSLTGNSNCLTGQSQLTFTATAGAGPFTLYISNGVTTATYTNIQSGVPFSLIPSPSSPTNYTLTGIKDANLCSARTPANSSVVISPSSIPITTSGNTSMCKLDSVQLTASGGLTYQWLPLTGLSNAGIANPKASPAVTTVYKVIVTNGAGCKDSTTLTVTIKPSPSIAVLPSNASFCIGDSVQLTASGGSSYQWSPTVGLSNGSIANPKAAPPATMIYKLVVTSADGCKDSVNKTVTKNTNPVITISPLGSICPGDSLQLSATGGTSYQWIPSTGLNDPLSANPKASPALTTIYKAIVINADGCKDSAITTVFIKEKPTITTSGSASICKGDSAQLTANGGISYQWSPTTGLNDASIANPKASPNNTIIYKVTVTGSSGCIDSAAVTITVNQLPVITVTPTTAGFCAGDSVQLSASGGINYQWSPSIGLSNTTIANPKAAPPTSTIYKLIVTDLNGCKDSVSKTVVRNTTPMVTINPSGAICPGDSLQLAATGGISYQWVPSIGLNNGNIANPKASPAITTIYKVIVANVEGCKDSASTTVSVKPKPVIGISASAAICKGDSAQLIATGGISYHWTPSVGLNNANISNPKASPSTTTSYTVIATGSNNCVDSANTVITINQPPAITITSNNFICAGDSIQLTATGGATYQWSPQAGLSNPTASSPKASPANTTTYKVLVFAPTSCMDSAFVTISLKPKPTITITPPSTICKGDTIQLNATGGSSYQWYPATGLSNFTGISPQAFPLISTNYTVIVSNNDGCKDSAQTLITISPKPEPSLGKDTSICFEDNLQLNATTPSATNYLWNTGANTPIININQPGVYSVQVVINGCTSPSTDTITVSDFPHPTISLGKDTSICSFYTLQITATGNNIANYLWNTGSTDSFIIVNNAGIYSINASNKCGAVSDEIEIVLDVCSEDLFFPSGFTPNGDSRNDVFKAAYLQGLQVFDYELQVFNRWGEKVFSTKEINKGWDGRINGKEQGNAVFVWLAKYRKTSAGALILKKGTTALIR